MHCAKENLFFNEPGNHELNGDSSHLSHKGGRLPAALDLFQNTANDMPAEYLDVDLRSLVRPMYFVYERHEFGVRYCKLMD